MNFSLSEEQLMVRDAARDFAQTELRPGVIKRDELQEFPDNLVKKMGALGFMGIMVDPKYGGSGMDTMSYVLVMEELSKVDASASVILVFVFFLRKFFFRTKTCWDIEIWISPCFFAKMGVKSYPFEELMVNLVS